MIEGSILEILENAEYTGTIGCIDQQPITPNFRGVREWLARTDNSYK